MTMRAKLVTLVLGIVLSFAAAAILFGLLLSPVARMEQERGYFAQLADTIKSEMLVLNRTYFFNLDDGSTRLAAAVSAIDLAFKDLDKFKILPKISTDVASSIETIRNLRMLNDNRLARLQRDFEDAQKDGAGLANVGGSKSLMELSLSDIGTGEAARSLQMHIHQFMADLSTTNDYLLDQSIATISEQYGKIDGSIAQARRKVYLASGAAIALVVALTVLGALLFANAIAKSVIKIERYIALLQSGDLSQRVESKSQDEIGALTRNMNRFLESLSRSLLHIKAVSRANIEVKDRLVVEAGEVMGSAAQVEASAKSIGEKIGTLDSQVVISSRSTDSIISEISDLNAQIEGQGAMVQEATASVTQMLTSLDNMGRIAGRDRDSTDELVAQAERGRHVFEAAAARIDEIPKSVGRIREMAAVISGIASRTNLLAMNAAIEAAHAGESGRGFSVVADEIRKLSEASTKSSKDISQTIASIVASVEDATRDNSSTSSTFAAIEERISQTSASMAQIYSAIEEIREGSRQILTAMTDLQERSLKVREGSLSMEGSSSDIRATMGELGTISKEVTSKIAEISLGIVDIATAIRSVAEQSERVGAESARLDEEVNRFRTREETLS